MTLDVYMESLVGCVSGLTDIEALHYAFVMWVGRSEFFAFIPDAFRKFYDVDIMGESCLAWRLVSIGAFGRSRRKQGFEEHTQGLCSMEWGARIKPKVDEIS